MTTATLASPAELRERFDEQGYLHVPGLVSPELVQRLHAVMRGERDALVAELLNDTGIDLDDPRSLQHTMDDRADPDAWFLALPRATQHLIRGELPLPVRLRPEFLELADQAPLTDFIRTLLGERRLRLHYPAMLRFKVPGAEQARVPLHQDGPYFAHLSNFVTVWIPLVRITPECGGVNVLEGSHRLGARRHEEAALWGNFVPPEAAFERLPDRHILMEAGDALVFGPHLLHYTHGNTSRQVRYSIDSRWFGGNADTTRQYYDLDSRRIVRMF